jgi:hypothetical protein
MATLANLRADVRSRIVEPTADFYSDTELDRWINQGYKRFIAMTEWAEKVKAYPMVANQFEYDLPSDVIKVHKVVWADSYEVEFLDMDDFLSYGGTSNSKSDRPYVYTTYPWDQKVRLYYVPSSASTSTTVNGSHSSSTTTLTVTSTDNFPEYGRLVVGSEQILYYAKNSTQFLQCVRGDGFTTASGLSGGETVSEAPLWIYMKYMPPDLTASIDTRLGANYEEALIAYACGAALGKRDEYEKSAAFYGIFKEITKTAKEEAARKMLDKSFFIKSCPPEE